MSEELFRKAYALLDDNSKLEEERVDAVEDIVRDSFPELKSNEVERLVLNVLMAHHRGKDAADAALSQKITRLKGTPMAALDDSMPSSAPSATSRSKTNSVNNSHLSKEGLSAPSNSSSLPSSGADSVRVALAGTKLDEPKLDKTETAFTHSPVQTTSLKPFDQLRNIFGWENTDEDIERALAHNDFDLERTISMLAGEQVDMELTKEQMSARIMCRYFIAGNCARGSQCMYSHDGSSRLCRFWLHQRCIADTMCLFLHEIPHDAVSRVESMQPLNTSNGTAIFNDLPALQSLPKLGAKPAKSAKQKAVKPSSLAPSLESPRLRSIKDVLGSHRGLVTLSSPRLVPWKTQEFGSNYRYCDLRKQAAFHAEQRNKLLQQSTSAWSANDAAQAKQLSSRGRYHEQEMIQCHRDAAELLWNQRHLPSSEVWLDLHGMDLGDAVAELEEKIEIAAEAKHSPRPVYVVTGRGHFKAKKYADQLTQYVVAYLDMQGYKHRDFGVDAMFGRITAVDPWSKIRDPS